MNSPVVDLLCDLVRIPSVNPMGRPWEGDEFLEGAVTDHLESLFRQARLAFHRQPVEPGRENIVARLDGEGSERLIVLEAHQDTVPVDGMTIEPWSPLVKDGRVTGRGSCDIKGGMACMLTAFLKLAEEPPSVRPTVVMACTVNEEYGFSGAKQLAESWQNGTHPLVHRVPDAVVVAEPTELDIVVAHKGTVRWRCHTRGRAGHSSRPDRGDNAIYRMAAVLKALQEYAEDTVGTLGSHPLVGEPTLSVGMIEGGISVNTIPDFCSIEIDRRLLPGEDPQAAWEHVKAELTDRLANDIQIEHEPAYLAAEGLGDQHNGALADELGAIAHDFGGGQKIGVPYGTDAPSFAAIGAPTVVCGPGSIEQAHTRDEWVAIDQLERAVEIYSRWIRG